MKKAAFFVEGQTELIFVRRLLEEVAGKRHIAFHEERFHAKTFQVLSSDTVGTQKYWALIVDCCSDNAVTTALLDRHAGLAAAGYELILGLRDLYPLGAHDLPAVRAAVASVLPGGLPLTHVTIAVAEVEAWFMQENTHFTRIDPACDRANILAATAFDIDVDRAEDLAHPAETLDTAYKVGGKRYTKSRRRVSRTVNKMDYEHLYLDRRAMLPSFDDFTAQIEAFLS